MPQHLHTIYLIKKDLHGDYISRYIFTYNDSSVDQVWDVLYRFADDDELDFTWEDAALAGRIIQESSGYGPTLEEDVQETESEEYE